MKRITTQALCLGAALALCATTLSASGLADAQRAIPRGSGGIAITAAADTDGPAKTHVRQIKPAPAGFTVTHRNRTAAPEASVLAAPSMKAPGRRPLYGNVVYADSGPTPRVPESTASPPARASSCPCIRRPK